MATATNLFEKYGIKEVADVTFYRIERKDEVYESQRKIVASSILKGSLDLQTVYPIVDGVGSDEGFEAYVFSDAEIIQGTNYECDDTLELRERITFTYTATSTDSADEAETAAKALAEVSYKDLAEAKESLTQNKYVITDDLIYDVELGKIYSNIDLDAEGYDSATAKVDTATPTLVTTVSSETTDDNDATTYTCTATYKVIYNVEFSNTTESADTSNPDADKDGAGTHEFTYEEQLLMLYSKNQNLINKTGTRYRFDDADTIFGNFEFNDGFAASPNSTEQVVVCGLPSKFTEMTYDLNEIKEEMATLSTVHTAKAYDITYTDYAELIVEDEMGYYNPKYLGYGYQKTSTGEGKITFFGSTADNIKENYKSYVEGNGLEADYALEMATMWGNGQHESINDAIDALKQKKKVIDEDTDNGLSGINKIYGGYLVNDEKPDQETSDLDVDINLYSYAVGDDFTSTTRSKYSLEKVMEALSTIVAEESDNVTGQNLKVVDGGETSNRAIYVKVDGMVDTSAGAFIYILKNKNAKKLASDKDGIFYFTDKKGNTVYYQDKIYAGTETLALVIVGNKGLIFVVNRYGTKNNEKVAWMVSSTGYVTNSQAETLVKNGLIHTVDITVNDETFEATCTVGGIKIRKTKKRVNRYVPVLFLDTLKVSTLEQTAEEVYATGGKGNANLIGWDYNKEITLSLEDALYSPASMSLMLGSYEGNDFRKGVKTTKKIDRMEKCVAERSFIVPAGNSDGVPSEGVDTPQAVYIDYSTMEPYQDGAPIAEGELYLKWTRSVAYDDNSIGNTIEISADKFPGTYKIVGETYARSKATGEDQRFQFIIPQAKVSSESTTITLEAEGDPTVFDMTINVLRPDDGVMVKLVQYDVVDNEEENDGSTMVKDTENLNLLDDAEMYRVSADADEDDDAIGATEY